MIWSWLQRIAGFAVTEDKRTLPGLYKPDTSGQQQQQQQQSGGHLTTQQQKQQHQQSVQKEYCLRMAFKLTPTYSSKLQARVKWLQVLRAAQEPAGGSWDLNFDPEYMTPRRLRQLVDIIDSKFLNGSFAEVCSPSYAVQDSRLTPEEAGDCDKRACSQATAGFEPATNTIFFYRPSWRKQPSLSCPVQADGVYCTNRLQWLAHTLAHEQVHCIVHHACPQARTSKEYTASHGHGPIFVSLNRHIFGHDTVRYKVGWGRLRPSLHVQPLQVTHAFLQHGSEDCSDHDQDLGPASSPDRVQGVQRVQQQGVAASYEIWQD